MPLAPINLQVVAANDASYRLVRRALSGHDDIRLTERAWDLTELDDIDKESPADVFIVSLSTQKEEMLAVLKIQKSYARPVVVFTALNDGSQYFSYLKKAGAFDVLEKSAPSRMSTDGYFRYLGAKLAALTRSANEVWKRQNKARQKEAS